MKRNHDGLESTSPSDTQAIDASADPWNASQAEAATVSLLGISETPTGLTPNENQRWQAQRRWLIAYANTCNVTQSCLIASVSRHTPYDWEEQGHWDFRAKRETARQMYIDGEEQLMRDRLANPTGNRGSDILLMFSLKAHRPEVYRELAVNVDDEVQQTMAELRRLGKRARAEMDAQGQTEQLTPVQEAERLVARKRLP